MSARTAVANLEKSLPVESTIEAEINSLIQEQIPKRIPVEQQTPKRVQIEDDAEKSRSFVARITSNSIDELGELSSDLTSALQNLQEYLKAEGDVEHGRDTFHSVHVETAGKIARTARRAGIRRFVHVSGIALYSQPRRSFASMVFILISS